ncbi:MAG: TetR/AcrR family transcriptional regulator [Myxococcota bacterium]
MSRRLSVEERRAQLLELGLELFSTQPYDDVSIDDIAERAGVSKGLLYHYFGGKRAFYMATVELSASQMLDALTPVADPDPAARVRSGLNRYLDFVDARADAFVALMRGGLGRDDEVSVVVDRTRRTLAARVVDGVEVASEGQQGVLRLVAASWIGAVEAASLDWLAHRDVDRDVMVEVLLGALMGSLVQAGIGIDRPG